MVDKITKAKPHISKWCVDSIQLSKVMQILFKFDILSLDNKEFKRQFESWMSGEASTVVLRELCLMVGYDYTNLRHQKLIDVLDNSQPVFYDI